MTRATAKAYETAMAALARKDLLRAGPYMETALKHRPRDGEMRHNLAGGLLSAGDTGRALILLSQALALRPKQRASAHMLSAVLKHASLKDAAAMESRGLWAALGFQDVDPQPLVKTAFAWMLQIPF